METTITFTVTYKIKANTQRALDAGVKSLIADARSHYNLPPGAVCTPFNPAKDRYTHHMQRPIVANPQCCDCGCYMKLDEVVTDSEGRTACIDCADAAIEANTPPIHDKTH